MRKEYRLIDWWSLMWLACRHVKYPHGSTTYCTFHDCALESAPICNSKNCPIWNKLRKPISKKQSVKRAIVEKKRKHYSFEDNPMWEDKNI